SARAAATRTADRDSADARSAGAGDGNRASRARALGSRGRARQPDRRGGPARDRRADRIERRGGVTTLIDRRRFLPGTASTVVMAGAPRVARTQAIKPGDTDVLVVTDVQNCFLPGGTLPVPEGDKIIPIINKLGTLFRNVVMTQDWHTAGHVSFA